MNPPLKLEHYDVTKLHISTLVHRPPVITGDVADNRHCSGDGPPGFLG